MDLQQQLLGISSTLKALFTKGNEVQQKQGHVPVELYIMKKRAEYPAPIKL